MSYEVMEIKERNSESEEYKIRKEETPELKYLKEHYGHFGVGSLLYGIFYAFCMYRNPAGVTFPFLVAATFGFCIWGLMQMGKKISRNTLVYAVLGVGLGVGVCLTTSEFLRSFHKFGVILLLLFFMTEQIHGNDNWNIENYLGHFLWKGLQTLVGIYYPFSHFKAYREKAAKVENPKRRSIYIGIGIALPLSFLVLLLLARADEIFSHLFGSLFRNILIPTRSFGAVIMAAAAFVFMYSFFAVNVAQSTKKEKENKQKAEPMIAVIVTGALTGIYLLFCTIQILYLFAGGLFSLPLGVTYAEYARQGFFELLFVSILNLTIVTLCVEHFREHKFLKACLTIFSLCTYILIFSSGYRMVLYIRQYHLTFLRILVLWFLGVLTIWLTGAIVSIYHNKINYFKFVVTVGAVAYLGFSLAKPDAVIAKYNISHIEELSYEDIAYMTQALSDDAAPEIARIDRSMWKTEDWEKIRLELESYHDCVFLRYRDLSWREWNLGKILAEKAVAAWETGGYE